MPYRYILFHKPFNVLSQFSPGSTPPSSGAPKTLADFLPLKGIYPVGRLDLDSEGLMLLTDDGPLHHRLAHPSFEHPREYWVQVEGAITEQAVERLRSGVSIQDYTTKPCAAVILPAPAIPERNPPIRVRVRIPTSWISLTMTEGRNRQVRRMTAAVGFPTLRLLRVALGPFVLEGLLPGTYRELRSQDLVGLKHKGTAPKNRP